MRVTVPFGRGGNVRRQGVILSVDLIEDTEKLKEIHSVLDDTPPLSDEMVKLIPWLKERTFCTLYDAARTILPVGGSIEVEVQYGLSSEYVQGDDLPPDMTRICALLKDNPLPRGKILSELELPEDSSLPEQMLLKNILVRMDRARQRVGDASLKMARLTEEYLNGEREVRLSPKQQDIVTLLRDAGFAAVKEICYFTGLTAGVLQTLAKYRVVELYDQPVYRNPYKDLEEPEPHEITHSTVQQTAYETLADKLDSGKTALLYGITGSGKTSVFLSLADKVLESGRQVIVMVPEIALTPQTLAIFHKRYGSKVAVFHSALSMGQRFDEWKRVRDGKAQIVVGTRSAVFAPCTDIGLIVMDEEQEHTYKSENSPRYHARDVAAFRAGYHKCLLLLCSATPSVGTYMRAKSGVYTLCTLPSRYGSALLPEVVTVDMQEELRGGNPGIISNQLYELLDQNLRDGMQSILLLNRRGHNTFISCRACGHVMTCENCSISLTYHSANGRMMCHYCGQSQPYSPACPSCGEQNIKLSGIGTQRVEDELRRILPSARILRLDADNVATRSHFDAALSGFAEGRFDIMLGTQMVAKGLDFPKVTLVGVLAAERALYSDDFRSYERAFSLITQVVGRSGRSADAGRAVIQTAECDNQIIEMARDQDYERFFETEILTRKLMTYPPYCDICQISFSGVDRAKTEAAAHVFLESTKAKIADEYADIKLTALGPTVASVPKISNKYRYRLLLKFRANRHSRAFLAGIYTEFLQNREHKDITAGIDINPETLI